MLLADQGADVVKVDRPGASRVTPLARVVYDRGKKRVALNLKTADGLAVAKTLVDSAGVVTENCRPGVMDRLGLGAPEVTGRNPGLVYLSLPGFASTDREQASIRAFEGIIGAATAQFTNLRPEQQIVQDLVDRWMTTFGRWMRLPSCRGCGRPSTELSPLRVRGSRRPVGQRAVHFGGSDRASPGRVSGRPLPTGLRAIHAGVAEAGEARAGLERVHEAYLPNRSR